MEVAMSAQYSLGDIVRQKALLMRDNGIVMVYKNEAPWHHLILQIKERD